MTGKSLALRRFLAFEKVFTAYQAWHRQWQAGLTGSAGDRATFAAEELDDLHFALRQLARETEARPDEPTAAS